MTCPASAGLSFAAAGHGRGAVVRRYFGGLCRRTRGRDGIVRYVGETGGAREDRFKELKRNPPNTRLRDWFNTEWRHGYPVRCALLEQCSYERVRLHRLLIRVEGAL